MNLIPFSFFASISYCSPLFFTNLFLFPWRFERGTKGGKFLLMYVDGSQNIPWYRVHKCLMSLEYKTSLLEGRCCLCDYRDRLSSCFFCFLLSCLDRWDSGDAQIRTEGQIKIKEHLQKSKIKKIKSWQQLNSSSWRPCALLSLLEGERICL